MTKPNIHPSPARGQAIADEARQSASHVRAALETLPEPASFYYSDAGDFDKATAEHRDRLKQLQAIADDLDTLAQFFEPAPGTVQTPSRLDEVCGACGKPYARHYAGGRPGYPSFACPGSTDWSRTQGFVSVAH